MAKTAAETLSRGLTNNTLNLSERQQVNFDVSIIASTANGYPFTYFCENSHTLFYCLIGSGSTSKLNDNLSLRHPKKHQEHSQTLQNKSLCQVRHTTKIIQCMNIAVDFCVTKRYLMAFYILFSSFLSKNESPPTEKSTFFSGQSVTPSPTRQKFAIRTRDFIKIQL